MSDLLLAGTTQLVDLYDYMATLRRMKDYAPAVLYPGHGPCIGEPGDGKAPRIRRHLGCILLKTSGLHSSQDASDIV